MSDDAPIEPATERRAAERGATLRKAVVSLLSGQGSIVRGVAVEVSADGLRLLTPVAQPVGSEIEILLSPKEVGAGEEPLRVEGRVVWSEAQEDGNHAMGVRLYEEARVGESVSIALEGAEWPGAQTVTAQTANLDAEKAKKRKRNRRWLGAGVALLLLLLLLRAGPKIGIPGWRGASRGATPAMEEKKREEERDGLDLAQQALWAGNPVAAGDAFAPWINEGNTPAARLIAALGQADALRMQGRAPEALVAVNKAIAKMEGAPKAWQELARAYRASLMKQGVDAAAPPLLMDALELVRPAKLDAALAENAAAENAATGTPAEAAEKKEAPQAVAKAQIEASAQPVQLPKPDAGKAPLRLEVDQSDYVLRVLRGDAVIAEYPVGLGSAGSTPLGDFVIANKLLDPDWFNRGERVKAGDARNPLGRHWMGLGNRQGPTTYGIHETKERGSIGAMRSRGCVRMRPEDATALFAICEVGVPVRIVE